MPHSSCPSHINPNMQQCSSEPRLAAHQMGRNNTTTESLARQQSHQQTEAVCLSSKNEVNDNKTGKNTEPNGTKILFLPNAQKKAEIIKHADFAIVCELGFYFRMLTANIFSFFFYFLIFFILHNYFYHHQCLVYTDSLSFLHLAEPCIGQGSLTVL